jgi:hypothetical protein
MPRGREPKAKNLLLCERCSGDCLLKPAYSELRYDKYGNPGSFMLCAACKELWDPICRSTEYYLTKKLYGEAVENFLNNKG